MFSTMQEWWNDIWLEDGEAATSEAGASAVSTDIVGTQTTPNQTTVTSAEANSALSSLSAIPFGIGGIFNKPLEAHLASMEAFQSEQVGITEKMNAESAIGSAEREKPLVMQGIDSQVAKANADIDVAIAMTGREGSVMAKQLEAEGARQKASATKEIENKQKQALDAVYNAEYGRILQKEVNDIDVPGRFWGYL